METLETSAKTKAGAGRKAGLSLFNYLNYREFLKDFYAFKKSTTPGYSYAVFSQRAGVKSPNYLKLVMEGTRNLTSDNLLGFAKGLGLSEIETLYWENLVAFNQAKTPEQRRYYLMRLTHSPLPKKGATDALIREIRDEWDYFSSWHHAAIRELVLLLDAEPQPAAVAEMLMGRITAEQAQESLELLQRLGFLVRDPATGRLVQAQALVRYFNHQDLANLMIRRFHRSTAELALECLDDEALHFERDYSGLTLAVSKHSLPRIKAKITAFRKELNEEFSIPPQAPAAQADQVFHLNLQLVPLTRGKKTAPQNP